MKRFKYRVEDFYAAEISEVLNNLNYFGEEGWQFKAWTDRPYNSDKAIKTAIFEKEITDDEEK